MDDSVKSQVPETIAIDAFWRHLEALKQFVRTHQAEALGAGLLLVMAVNMFAAISHKGITNDEIVHIPAGYYHLVAGDFQLNNEHPPLIKMWAALPLLLIQPNESPPTPGEVTGNSAAETWKYLDQFWPNNKEHFAA